MNVSSIWPLFYWVPVNVICDRHSAFVISRKALNSANWSSHFEVQAVYAVPFSFFLFFFFYKNLPMLYYVYMYYVYYVCYVFIYVSLYITLSVLSFSSSRPLLSQRLSTCKPGPAQGFFQIKGTSSLPLFSPSRCFHPEEHQRSRSCKWPAHSPAQEAGPAQSVVFQSATLLWTKLSLTPSYFKKQILTLVQTTIKFKFEGRLLLFTISSWAAFH